MEVVERGMGGLGTVPKKFRDGESSVMKFVIKISDTSTLHRENAKNEVVGGTGRSIYDLGGASTCVVS
jgi:hypothetical protein